MAYRLRHYTADVEYETRANNHYISTLCTIWNRETSYRATARGTGTTSPCDASAMGKGRQNPASSSLGSQGSIPAIGDQQMAL